MSVVMNFAMFPTQRAGSASPYVSKVVEKVRSLGYENQLTAMGTLVETETLAEALNIINEAYSVLESDHERVYVTVNIDIRKGKSNRIRSKVQSIEDKLATR